VRTPPVLGLAHPGRLGTALALAMRANLALVLWAEQGRSRATTKRAEWADFVAVGSVGDLVSRSDVVLAACPPTAVLEVARQAAGQQNVELFIAASDGPIPDLADLLDADRLVAATVSAPPPWEERSARLVLSGRSAARGAELFAGGPLTVVLSQ
jgi:predicted dinucleotide-binding enzyme